MRIKAVLFVFLIGLSSPWAAQVGLSLNGELLDVDLSTGRIEYDGARQIRVGYSLELPARRAILECPDSFSPHAPEYRVVDADTIGYLDRGLRLYDIPTGEQPEYIDMAERLSRIGIGAEPIWVSGQSRHEGRTQLELLVFPITVTKDGAVVFNREIRFSEPGAGQVAWVAEVPCFSDRQSKEATIDMVASEGDPVYLIVTGAEMADALQRLANYKTAIGLSAAVEVIDDIVAAYDGRDDAERLRERLLQFYAGGGVYVLLAGDETVLPLRYVYHFDVSVPVDTSLQQICDLYFADVDGEWEVDGDGVWGEPNADSPDRYPDLLVGRLPFGSADEAEAWIDKLIKYETDPGSGDPSYLTRAYFFCADQMRDYGGDGQHARISAAYPPYFDIDTLSGIEMASGDDPNPVNLCAAELVDTLNRGFGLVNIVSHGNMNRFEVRTANYNEFPKCWLSSTASGGDNACVDDLSADHAPGFYYSLACDNGAFDKDSPPFEEPYRNLVQALLAEPSAGAVGMIANSRWGWVGSSHLLQKAFFDSLFANPDQPAVMAFNAAKARYSYYRDANYGLTFFGDPSMRVYTDIPNPINLATSTFGDRVEVTLTADGVPVAGATVYCADSSGILAEAVSDAGGLVSFDLTFSPGREYLITALKDGHTIGYREYSPGIVADVDDEAGILPESWTLAANYPNPFNPATTIAFDIARRAQVTLTVYNVLGRAVSELVHEQLPAGRHQVVWDGTDNFGRTVGSGVYFYRLVAGDFVASRKMVLLR